MLFIRVYDRFCRGKSRSATVVLAYLMQKNSWTLERALKKVRARRECVAPHDGFLAQLKLYESMGFGIDASNVQFKMFREAALCEKEGRRCSECKYVQQKSLTVTPSGTAKKCHCK